MPSLPAGAGVAPTTPEETARWIHRQLVEEGILEPLGSDPGQARIWDDHILACLAERRLGEIEDPRELGPELRRSWVTRASERPEGPFQARSDFEAAYWILDRGTRVGTIALAQPPYLCGASSLPVSSLYLLPEHRGRGLTYRLLTNIRDLLGQRGLALLLRTHWTWTSAARLYLRYGMWVWMFKHDLTFGWDVLDPEPCFEVDGDRATLSMRRNGDQVPLVDATRHGDRLTVEEHPILRDPDLTGTTWVAALSTLSVHLATLGWPLIRSAEDWDRCAGADGGSPEALAWKIQGWEAWSRLHSWISESPRIPGLELPTWEELNS